MAAYLVRTGYRVRLWNRPDEAEGRTVERLGLAGLDSAAIREKVQHG